MPRADGEVFRHLRDVDERLVRHPALKKHDALEVYARMMQRDRDTGARVDALVRGADWAQIGTNGDGSDGGVASLDDLKERSAAL